MSYHSSRNITNDVGVDGNMLTSFATVDSAYSQSPSMKNFQNKMMCHNPLISQNLIDKPDQAQSINNDINALLHIHNIKNSNNKIDDKMDKNIDEIIGSVYAENNYVQKQKENNVAIYNDQYPQYIPNMTNNNSGMGTFKIILLLILIAAFLYGGYWLYKLRAAHSPRVARFSFP